MTAILLAAGYGTRVRALFPDLPKALIRIGERTLLDHLLANLARSGAIGSVTLVTNDRFHAAFEEHLEEHPPPLPMRLISDGTSHEQERLGALRDLALALDQLGPADTVLAAATDKLLAFELAAPLAFARQCGAAVNVCVRMADRNRLAGTHGCVLLGADQRIVDFEEKPTHPKSPLASQAIYVLPAAAHLLLQDYLTGGGNPDAPGHFLAWLARRIPVYGYVAGGLSYDVGTPETYAAARRAYAAGTRTAFNDQLPVAGGPRGFR